MKDKPYTADECRRFDLITERLSSRDQTARIEARFEIKRFVAEHGQEKCDAMFAHLQKRDKAEK